MQPRRGDREHDGPTRAPHDDHSSPALRRRAGHRGAPPRPRQRGADRERHHPHIGTEVGAVGGSRRVGAHRPAPCHRDGDDRRDARGHRPPPEASVTQEEDEYEWPDDVELLLDREAPEVADRRRRGERADVPAVADLVPVGHLCERGADLGGECSLAVGPPDAEDRGDGDGGEGAPGQWPQSSGSAPPERPERDPSRPVVFADQQRGDEVAGEDEEEVDPDEAAGEDVGVGVVDDDGEHSDRSEAVQPRPARRRLDDRGVDGGRLRRLGHDPHEGTLPTVGRKGDVRGTAAAR